MLKKLFGKAGLSNAYGPTKAGLVRCNGVPGTGIFNWQLLKLRLDGLSP